MGTLDQAGNVWEWCRDEWDEAAYHGRDGQLDPVVLPKDEADTFAWRVLRGGSWATPSPSLVAAIRRRTQAQALDPNAGFRVVRLSGPEP